jgi:hypothetical protein
MPPMEGPAKNTRSGSIVPRAASPAIRRRRKPMSSAVSKGRPSGSVRPSFQSPSA